LKSLCYDARSLKHQISYSSFQNLLSYHFQFKDKGKRKVQPKTGHEGPVGGGIALRFL